MWVNEFTKLSNKITEQLRFTNSKKSGKWLDSFAYKNERICLQDWKQLDLDELVRILTLPKYWELEHLKDIARSVITDLHDEQFQYA